MSIRTQSFSMEIPILLQFFSAFITLLFFSRSSQAIEFLYRNKSITYPETIASANGIFSLGFFPPGEAENYYLGIWYTNIPVKKVVWVANRKYPVRRSSATLSINTLDGNIMITDGEMSYKVSNSSDSATSETFAVLQDSGNLILKEGKGEVFWQSFDYPTDTLLPGMSLGTFADYYAGPTEWNLTSWRSEEDPAPGDFSLVAPSGSSLTIKKGNETYWEGSVNWYETNQSSSRPEVWKLSGQPSEKYWTYSGDKNAISRMVLDMSGQLKLQKWSEDEQQWQSLLSSKCWFHSCGAFSYCNESAYRPCACMRGFGSNPPDITEKGNESQKCVRKALLKCQNSSAPDEDRFYQMQNVSFPNNPVKLSVKNTEECKSACAINCSCVAYALDHDQGCLVWDRELFDLKIPLDGKRIGDFYLRLAASEFINPDNSSRSETEKNSGNEMQLWTIIILAVSLGMLTLCLLIYQAKRTLKRKGANLLLFDIGLDSIDDNTEHCEQGSAGEGRNREVKKLPLFSFRSVASATENFSEANKLGEGGFGPVYKGKLLKGEEIAVKRLSRRSGQGWEELKNEAFLIAKLQHKNLVRLLGCCIEQDEKILIYEYMPNKSLDFFLFDPSKRGILDWRTRARIIEGIAHGLLYLHQYSRVRIIHRDLKASNILLDKEMNPKISDFGMARIFGDNEIQANTNRIVGTYGYMSPEYALEGLFSIKSDVFSFGVLLLEIVSGKRNTGFYQTSSLNLLRYTWEYWTSQRGLELMDPILDSDSSTSTDMLLRYVQIALLCVQECPADRPTMSDIVSMLSNESTLLPSPKPPAFSNVRKVTDSKLLPRIPDTVNNLTVSILEAR